jgi:hypothetical protein
MMLLAFPDLGNHYGMPLGIGCVATE